MYRHTRVALRAMVGLILMFWGSTTRGYAQDRISVAVSGQFDAVGNYRFEATLDLGHYQGVFDAFRVRTEPSDTILVAMGENRPVKALMSMSGKLRSFSHSVSLPGDLPFRVG